MPGTRWREHPDLTPGLDTYCKNPSVWTTLFGGKDHLHPKMTDFGHVLLEPKPTICVLTTWFQHIFVHRLIPPDEFASDSEILTGLSISCFIMFLLLPVRQF